VGVGALYPGVKKMDPEGDDSSPMRVKIENAWSSRYIMTWSLGTELMDSSKAATVTTTTISYDIA
jgi:hypothetical protein